MERAENMAGKEISDEQLARIREAAKHPVVYTKDCPKLTDEQLEEFKPDNFDTLEERYQVMVEMGIVEKKEELVLA